jgi:hypothetical protein
VKFLCVKENALCDVCHARIYISDTLWCRKEPVKFSRFSWSVASIAKGTGVFP